MGDIVDSAGKLTEGGIVMILLFIIIAFGSGVALLFVSVHRKIFGSKANEGFIPRLLSKLEAFLDRMAAAIERVAESTEENTQTAKNIEVTTKKTDSTINKLLLFMERHDINFETFRKVWKMHTGVLLKMAKHGGLTEVEDDLKRMEHLLDDENGRK